MDLVFLFKSQIYVVRICDGYDNRSCNEYWYMVPQILKTWIRVW